MDMVVRGHKSQIQSTAKRKGMNESNLLKRSINYNYENLVGEISTPTRSSWREVTPFDRANDPPLIPLLPDEDTGSIRSLSTKSTHDSFYQLSLNTIEMPAARGHDRGGMSVSMKPRMNAIGSFHPDWPKNLQAVKVGSSDSETTAKPTDIPQSVVQSNKSAFHNIYSTDKPHNFSIHESPVKKLESTLNSLDCSFDVNLKSIDADKSAVEESVTGSKWVSFGDSFKQRGGSFSNAVSFSSQVEEEAFDPSVFASLDRTDTGKAYIHRLEERLASLERIVHGISDPTTMRVSDSTHSDHSPDARMQVMNRGFIIEGTEILQASCRGRENEEITCTDWGEESRVKKSTKGSKFSMKYIFRSRLFGKKG
mmetsp:Transcript_32343/g.67835  ORF Transcript_32343/g.67835 Transcript_32343/m.67835 type:complete len:367 (+) Transcript_32343:235-1335(+)